MSIPTKAVDIFLPLELLVNRDIQFRRVSLMIYTVHKMAYKLSLGPKTFTTPSIISQTILSDISTKRLFYLLYFQLLAKLDAQYI